MRVVLGLLGGVLSLLLPVLLLLGLEGEDGKVLLQDIADQNGWNEKTMKGWFGTGSKRNRELCKLFEKTSREGDKRTYIQRKKQGEQGATV